MSFFENNRERVRSDLLKLLHDEDELPSTPCSKNSTCDIDSDDSDDSDVDDILEETSNVFKSLKKDTSTSVKDEELKIDEKTLNEFKLDEDEDEFINSLIDQDLDDDDSDVKTFVDEKPYKIEIFSSFEPDDEYQEPKKVDLCNTEYIDFDAFYENYIKIFFNLRWIS